MSAADDPPLARKPPGSVAWRPRVEQVVIVTAAVMAIVAVALVIGLINISRQHDQVVSEVYRTRGARIAAYALMQASVDAETGLRGFLLTGDESFLEPYGEGRTNAETHLSDLTALAQGHQALESKITRANALMHEAFTQLAATLEARRSGTLSPAALRAQLNGSKSTMDQLRAEVGTVLTDIETVIENARERENATRDSLYWLGGVLAALTLVAALLTIWAVGIERRGWRAALAAMEEARERAAASNLAKTRFLAVASHDMRQPLHALTLYLSALQRRVDNPEALDIIARMERATQSMVTMFATLLDLARIQAEVVTPEVTSFRLHEVLDRIVAEHPGSDLVAEDTALEISTDPVLLERLLRNLVANAIKHGGGTARIETRQVGRRVEICVVDHGRGVAPEDRERIFDEFVRIEPRSGGEGLGLGLAIVKRIANLLELDLVLRDTPGGGASFVVSAPLSKAPERVEAESEPEVGLAGVSVLLMDDDALAREAVAGALSDLGADVRACVDGAEVDAAVASGFHPQLLVMDLRIHGELIGVDIANRAQAALNPRPNVIIVTADTAADTLAMLRESGHEFLIKPVDPRELAAAARRAA